MELPYIVTENAVKAVQSAEGPTMVVIAFMVDFSKISHFDE
jgi:hypothetical protein